MADVTTPHVASQRREIVTGCRDVAPKLHGRRNFAGRQASRRGTPKRHDGDDDDDDDDDRSATSRRGIQKPARGTIAILRCVGQPVQEDVRPRGLHSTGGADDEATAQVA